ncbi:MAG: NADH:ubiquinone reductase (Na(+)-transporting) subunit A [Simkaniaceae bacterium]|nr:NADH:ubiquinone reductase (Na(+)-transporting) subunit A [Simkaniaceae bacterium]
MKGEPTDEIDEDLNTNLIGHDVSKYHDIKFKLLVHENDFVHIGQPLLCDKSNPERVFVSHASGVISNIIRGDKRRLHAIVVKRDASEKQVELPPLKKLSKDTVIQRMLQGGAFFFIRKRPCDVLADPKKLPRTIFVQGLESAPFRPKADRHVIGFENDFVYGMRALSKIVAGNIHFIGSPDSELFKLIENVEVTLHSAMGPHPIANPSIHIEKIDPIHSPSDEIWTVHVSHVVYIGALMQGRIHCEQLISMAGEGVHLKNRKLYRDRKRADILSLCKDKLCSDSQIELIAGDPLTGRSLQHEMGFLAADEYVISALLKSQKREILHFIRIGKEKLTLSRGYLSRFLRPLRQRFTMTNLLHGEERAFIDGRIYDRVMPLRIPTMPLIKALLAEDYEAACELGLLEIAPEDFALAAFICPSKIDHMGTIRRGLNIYASQYLE